MGASTYEWMLRHAEHVAASSARPGHTQPAWIFASHAADDRRRGPGFVQGDVRPVHAAMLRAAAGAKNVWIVGGGDLAGQFHDAGLLDEILLPGGGSVTLGRSKPR